MLKIMSIAAVAALVSSQAMAGDLLTDRVQSATVRIGQTNFDNPAQVQALYARIGDVARRVCVDQAPHQVLLLDPPDRACVDHVVAEAVGKISQPRLTAVYQNQGPAAISPRSALAGNDQ
jgi:UrcA family protein